MISLIIPCYNAAPFIKEHLIRLSKFLSNNFLAYEIIVVDDCSTDTTLEVLSECTAADEHIKVIAQKTNQGKGAAIKVGMFSSTGDVVLFTDADLPYDLNSISIFAKELEGGTDVVLGARVDTGAVAGQQSHRTLLSKVFAAFANVVLYQNVPDTQAGFKGFNKRAAQEIFSEVSIPGFGFDVEVIVIAQKKHMNIKSLPVMLVNQGPSTVRVRRDGLRMCLDLVYIFYKHRLHS